MRARILILLLAVGPAAMLCGWAAAGQAPQAQEYTAMVAALKAGDSNIDYTRLRLSWVDSREYKKAKDTSAAEDAMWKDLNAKDYAKALKDAETVLDSEYVNIDAHFVAYAANKELGEQNKSGFHLAVFRGLLDSIRKSGDGLTPETAWVVINVHEEYVLLRAMGYQPSGQSVMHKDGHNYDAMKVKKREDGSDATFYFNVDIPFKHYGV
jgi:hypothetical protein